MTTETTTTARDGVNYLMGRGKGSGRILGILREIGRYDALGDVVLRDQSMRTLDDLAFKRIDGVPAYRNADVIAAARAVYSGAR